MQKISQEAMQTFMVWLQNPMDGRLSVLERDTIESVVRRNAEWTKMVWRYNIERTASLTGRNPSGHREIPRVGSSNEGRGVGIFLKDAAGRLLLRTVCHELITVSISTPTEKCSG